MSKPVFEEMLAQYPPEKRELARAAYNRFVDGDSEHFFTQLFSLLDIYANYTSRIPLAVKQASEETLATIKDIREEIGLLAQTVESRSVNLSNATEETTARCLETQKKCEAAAQRLEKITKEIGKQIDVAGIVESIRKGVDAGVNKEVIKPFMQRTEELSEKVLPTLESIRNTNEQAARVWPERIWKIALVSGLILGLAVAIVGIGIAYWKIKRHYDTALAAQIVSEANTLTQNSQAFTALGVLNVQLHVGRSTDANGVFIPNTYCLYIEGAQEADMAGNNGRIFFGSNRSDKELQPLLQDTQARQGYQIMGQ
ncbi:MAG TPA: hypothetical protein VGH42_14285 [Verrucomicrobiae bacterium]|jgi:hypothetical protein